MDKNKHNYFFEVYQIHTEMQEEKCLGMINLLLDSDFYLQLFTYANANIKGFAEAYLSVTQPNETLEDSINFIYGKNIKSILFKKFPNILIKLACVTGEGMIEKDNVGIRLITSYEYRQYNTEYDNQLKFIEYINSEKAHEDKKTQITEEILINNGFEYLEKESNLTQDYQNQLYGKDNYKVFRKWTNDSSPLKLDIDNGVNNRGTEWHLHIDNDHCESIGSADINNIWEFNTLMEIFSSKFRL